MKLSQPYLPITAQDSTFVSKLLEIMRRIISQVNSLSDGNLSAFNNAAASTDIAGAHAVGDFVKNNAPAELGSAGSKYIITGWICVTAGTPGTWKECRTLTGG